MNWHANQQPRRKIRRLRKGEILMTLRNLITIADLKLPMVIYGRKGNKQLRYNFATNKWDENTIITSDKITVVGKFIRSGLYWHLQDKTLLNWSTLKPQSCKALVNENSDFFETAERNVILNISLDLS